MKKLCLILTVTATFLLAAAGSSHASFFTVGNLIVSRVGNGTTALANTGGGISLLEYTPGGTLVNTLTVSTFDGSTPVGLQWSGTATSEGVISLSQDGQSLTVVGYLPPFTGSGSIANRTDAQAPRAFLTVDHNGIVSSPTTIGSYSGNNIRSGVSTSTGTYFAGGNSGTIYRTTTNTTIQTDKLNTRVANIFNGNLYVSTGSAAGTPNVQGILAFSGTPTTSSTPTLLIGVDNPWDFAINPAGDVAYIAISSSSPSVGEIQRWAFDGSSWSNTHTLSGAGLVTGLAVSFGSTSDVIYSVNPTTFQSVTFNGTSFGTLNTLASAGSNFAFRGLEFAPIPEPSSFALLGAGLGIAILLRRRRKA